MTASRVAFVLLLAVEAPLLALAVARRGRLARAARVALFLLPIVLAISLRGYQAFGTRDVLDWDETYYLSLAVTGASGHGLYPYIYGFGPMRVMGGIGYAAYVDAAAVLLAGPTVLALRAVSLAGAAAGLLCLWLLVRKWYGSGTAWMAAALTATLHLFVIANSARMDSLAFGWVAAALLVVATAFERRDQLRWHALAGLVFGLGLEVHIDTSVTAAACGLAYLVAWLRDVKARGRCHPPTEMLVYMAGLAVGIALYAGANILPDPDAFYRTAALARVDATAWYSRGTSSVLGSFLDPRIVFAREWTRYGILLHVVHPLEIALGAAAFAALIVRRNASDRLVIPIAAGVVLAAAVVLTTASPLYSSHTLPALAVPLAPLFTHGLRRSGKVALDELRLPSTLACVVVLCALFAVNNVRAARSVYERTGPPQADLAFAARVRAVVDPRCIVAGDGSLYVRHFAGYPFYVSTRRTEVEYAMLFYGVSTEEAYWAIKKPDAVLSRVPPGRALAGYLSREGLTAREPGIWIRAAGCRGGP